MERKFHNVDENTYNRIKIFLISNYNIRFLTSSNPNLDEVFEITFPEFVSGEYDKDFSLCLKSKSDDSLFFDTLSGKIQALCGNISVNEIRDDNTTIETSDKMTSILEHILECDLCKEKFSEILSHHQSRY